MKAIAGAVALTWLLAPAAHAAWTRPSVLLTGEETGLLSSVARPDGSLRAAISDSEQGIALGLRDGTAASAFGAPLVVARAPAAVAQVALAADGSGVALEVQRNGPS